MAKYLNRANENMVLVYTYSAVSFVQSYTKVSGEKTGRSALLPIQNHIQNPTLPTVIRLEEALSELHSEKQGPKPGLGAIVN